MPRPGAVPGPMSSGSSAARIQPSPTGVRTAVIVGSSDSNAARARCRLDPRPLPEGGGRGGAEHVQVPARELEAGVPGIDRRARHRPDRRLSGAVPAHQDPAGRSGIAQRVGRNAERAPRLAVGHPPASQQGLHALGRVLGEPAAFAGVREPAEREHASIPGRDHERAEAGTPQLHEGWILPRRRAGPIDTRMDREQRRPGHAVLEPGPGGAPQRVGAGREPLDERADSLAVREDLRPGDLERVGGHGIAVGRSSVGHEQRHRPRRARPRWRLETHRPALPEHVG